MNHITGSDPVDHWLIWMRAQAWSENTIRDRVSLIRRVSAAAGVPPDELDADQVLTWLAACAASSTSLQTYHASLRTWFRWLVESGRREDDPMGYVRRPRAGRRVGRSLQTGHVIRLLSTPMHARTRTMVLLMAYQGLRCFEVAKLRGEDVDLVGGELLVVGKGDVEAVLPLHPVIDAEARRRPRRGWWFPQHVPNRESGAGGPILGNSVSGIVGAAMRRADVPGSAHSLRHWYGSELLRQGVDLRVIQQLMRHSSLATTERYLHVDDRARRAGLLRLPDVTASGGLRAA